MNTEKLEKRIDEISVSLYQNKEEESMQEMGSLIPCLQVIINEMEAMLDEKAIIFAINAMNELIEAYQNQDMLCMADCLQEKMLLLVGLYKNITQ